MIWNWCKAGYQLYDLVNDTLYYVRTLWVVGYILSSDSHLSQCRPSGIVKCYSDLVGSGIT